jgi:hypothetical protein
MLGFEVAQSTVSKYMVRPPKPPSQTWKMFLQNHAEAIAAIDMCVVPTPTRAEAAVEGIAKAASACSEAPAIRSVPEPCTSGTATRTRSTASTAQSNRGPSARALNHLLGRIPVRPFLLVVDGRCARPPEVLAPYADAIAERPPATLDERLIAELRPQPPPSPA